MVLGPIRAVARIILGIDHFEVRAGLEPQAEAFDALRDHRGPTHEDRLGEALIDDDLHGAQHALVLALCEDDSPGRILRSLKDRLHQQAGVIHELQQTLVIRIEIGDRSRRDARVHRGPGDRRRYVDDQPRIEWLGNQVFGAELHVLDTVRRGNDIRLLGVGQIGERAHRRELHRLVDRGRADVECAAKDERKAQNVVHLVRKIRAAGGDDSVGPRRLGDVGHDLGLRIGEREDQRLGRHRLQKLGLEHARG